MASGYNTKSKAELIRLLEDRDKVLENLLERVNALEQKLASSNPTFADSVINLERQLYAQQQYTRRECVEIVGIPVTITDNEIENHVIKIFKHAGVEVTSRNFQAVHRINKKGTVIAKLVNRKDAINILWNKKKLRDGGDVVHNKFGVGRLYINESLCPAYRRLFGICNNLYKEKLASANYTVNGKLFIVTGDDKHEIKHLQDLIKIFGKDKIEKRIADHKNRYNS